MPCYLTDTSKKHKLNRIVNMTFSFPASVCICVCVYCYSQTCKAAIFSSRSFWGFFFSCFFFLWWIERLVLFSSGDRLHSELKKIEKKIKITYIFVVPQLSRGLHMWFHLQLVKYSFVLISMWPWPHMCSLCHIYLLAIIVNTNDSGGLAVLHIVEETWLHT